MRLVGPLSGGLLLLAILVWLPSRLVLTPVDGTVLAHGRIERLETAASGAPAALVVLLEGARADERLLADLGSLPAGTPPYRVGDEVVVGISEGPEGEWIAVTDRWRVPLLGGLLGLFALLVVLVAGVRGIRALVALAVTVGILMRLLLPGLVAGLPPVPLAIGSGVAVTAITLLLTEGARRSTLAAALGTAGALAAAGAVASAASALGSFSPLAGSEETAFLSSVAAGVDLGGLLLAGLILGAVGVLDDVTVTQAVTVEELAAADPAAARLELARRAMRIGRAHIGATVNTLVLAYAAASLPLLLLLTAAPAPLGALASGEAIAIELVRGLAGSIGIVLAVPLTTLLAALLVAPSPLTGSGSDPGSGRGARDRYLES